MGVGFRITGKPAYAGVLTFFSRGGAEAAFTFQKGNNSFIHLSLRSLRLCESQYL